ncbi:MAG: ATP-dependent DNA ligase, partial [Candidatus Rokubacteria bacterium]|nr:ATP-dependent DNA ligase [Candidatus Rokubacteria bacterium]
MATLASLVDLSDRLAATAGRLEKRRLVAEYLKMLAPEDVPIATLFLTGRAFPPSDPRTLNVRSLPAAPSAPGEPPLTLVDVAMAFAEVAEASGAGARRAREARLAALAARATPGEHALVDRIIAGELRTGVSDGLVLESIAQAAGADLALVRRAALFLGDLSAVAPLALTGGAAALAGVAPRLFVPLLPMLAEIGTGFEDVLSAHGGASALEYKYDGARIQLHA